MEVTLDEPPPFCEHLAVGCQSAPAEPCRLEEHLARAWQGRCSARANSPPAVRVPERGLCGCRRAPRSPKARVTPPSVPPEGGVRPPLAFPQWQEARSRPVRPLRWPPTRGAPSCLCPAVSSPALRATRTRGPSALPGVSACPAKSMSGGPSSCPVAAPAPPLRSFPALSARPGDSRAGSARDCLWAG